MELENKNVRLRYDKNITTGDMPPLQVLMAHKVTMEVLQWCEQARKEGDPMVHCAHIKKLSQRAEINLQIRRHLLWAFRNAEYCTCDFSTHLEIQGKIQSMYLVVDIQFMQDSRIERNDVLRLHINPRGGIWSLGFTDNSFIKDE